MAAFFTRERFGRPQLYAGLLLLLFVSLSLWLMWRTPLQEAELNQIQRGWLQWTQREVASGPESPLIALIASVGIAVLPGADLNLTGMLPMFLARLPLLFLALLRAAALWYVTRRLYGNAGGYVALALYCFSFPIIEASALVNANGPAAWGFFGAIFSAIALSHTVYALRESPQEQLAGFREWRWRRVGLLGVAFGVAVGSHFFTALVVLLTFAFMLYLAPGRRTACMGILTVACAIGLLIILAAYFFHVGDLVAGAAQSLQSARAAGPGDGILGVFAWPASPAVFVLLAVSGVTYLAWRRTRYFGNSAPLIVLGVLWLISPLAPDIDGARQLVLTFAFVFVAGIIADLLETAKRKWIIAGLVVLLALHAAVTMRFIAIHGG